MKNQLTETQKDFIKEIHEYSTSHWGFLKTLSNEMGMSNCYICQIIKGRRNIGRSAYILFEESFEIAKKKYEDRKESKKDLQKENKRI